MCPLALLYPLEVAVMGVSEGVFIECGFPLLPSTPLALKFVTEGWLARYACRLSVQVSFTSGRHCSPDAVLIEA